MNAAGEGAPTRAAVDACIHAALQRRSDLTKLLAEAGAARVRVPGLAAALDEASVARTPAPDQARILLLFLALTLNPTPRRPPPPHMIDEFLAGEARFCCVHHRNLYPSTAVMHRTYQETFDRSAFAISDMMKINDAVVIVTRLNVSSKSWCKSCYFDDGY